MTDALLQDLRARFRETSRIRLDEMKSLLAQLQADPRAADVLKRLATHFHGLAGMGATYGFPRVSELGDEAEGLILPLVKREQQPDAATLARFQTIVTEIEAVLGSGGIQPPAAIHVAKPRSTLVLIESDAALAAAIIEAVEREEMAVQRLTSEAAIASLDGKLPDAAIVEADAAYDFLEALRGHRGGDGVGVIVIGAAADFVEKVHHIRSGADAFIDKPVDVAALERRISALRGKMEQPARRILAVEDDATTAALIRGILGSAGYEVEICRDPATFEKTLFAFEPDLLLMDVQLSEDLSGHDLVRYIRQNERFSTLPVIIVTSDSERRAIVEGANAGADLLVTKPVDWDLLLSQIAARLERASVVRELTDRDPLTGVLTRGAFDTRARQRGIDRPAVLILLDLDHFKEINDTQGHIAGDRVLSSLGALLRRRLRQSDIVARYGGEEFALLLEGVQTADAVQLCEDLLSEFRTTVNVTFSAGVAQMEDSFDTAFRRADAALYEAKRAGRARVVAV